MPAISKIRLTNVVYEGGDKRYNDEIFYFDGHNGAIVLENGGGKTVFIHTVLQAIIPHTNLGNRKIKETLQLENAPAHIAIEWIKNENPRRYVTTCVSLFLTKDGIDSYRYVIEYEENSPERIEEIPFVRETINGKRPAEKGEIAEYYSQMKQKSMYAQTFTTIGKFREYIEEHYHIIANEWENIVHINGDEGGIDKFFEKCTTTNDLYDRLLIPTVEAALQGHEAGMFADMFEKQREGFHMYKKLSESMKENQLIQEELEKYVDIFKDYTEKERSYLEKKAYAKGLWTLLNHQKLSVEKEHDENEMLLAELENDKGNHRLKQESFLIFTEEEKQEELKEIFQEHKSAYEEGLERLKKSEKEYDSLQYAKLKQERVGYEQQLRLVEEEMARQEKNEELTNLEGRLEETNRALKGYFIKQLEGLDKFIQGKNMELRPLKDEREQLLLQEKKRTKDIRDLDYQQGVLKGEQKALENNAEKLKQELLAKPDQEDIAVEKVKWEERLVHLDETIIEMKQAEKQIALTVAKLLAEKDEKTREKQELSLARERELMVLKQLQEAHDQLIEELSSIKAKWGNTTDLYMREHSIKEEISSLLVQLRREQETLLQQERIALRLLDDYEEQDIFFGDVYLQGLLQTWKNQFEYLVTGVEFFQGLDKEQKAAYEGYPLWPITLITTKQAKAVLLDRLHTIRQRMNTPIQVLSLDEVQSLTMESAAAWVEPAYWEDNLIAENFVEWKKELREHAQVATEKRRLKELELRHVENMREKLDNYFADYPKERKDELKEREQKLDDRIGQIEGRLKKIADEVGSLEVEQGTLRSNIDIYQNEMNGLTGKITKAYDYLQIMKKFQENCQELAQLKAAKEQAVKKLTAVQKQISRYDEDIHHLKEEISQAKFEKEYLKRDDLYKEVIDEQAIFTNEEKEVILEQRKWLDYKIREIETSYNELKEKHTFIKSSLNRVNEDLIRLKEEKKHIDETLVFPPNGVVLMETLRNRMKLEVEQVESQREKVEKAENAHIEQKGFVKSKIESFQKNFPNKTIYRFPDGQALAEIEHMLADEAKQLQEREGYLIQEKRRITKEANDIQEAMRELDRFQVAHHFNSTQIEGKVFSESEMTAFTYKRQETVKDVTAQLTSAEAKVNESLVNVDKGKQRFRTFCDRTIQDQKLKRMAIDGIEQKRNYDDILLFRKNMVERLEQADKYARDYISKNDKDLQAFIDRIHHHLRTVVEQLLIIPKKTKVKVESSWKEIYKFNIPEWDDEEGKERIREHIHWILEQLDSDRFLNKEGSEDRIKVRDAIEKWLETKQLLQIVINNEKMKVNCRKVTNDNQVTSRYHTWEESNKWSGGEKWSKNMTLFLGLLNFVAEKKQHTESSIKRNRAVILDNPFGRASSDHVLSPVFFIAEQLGFQIIALTAHAEGKFLQDYFPILYSCKLRSSLDPRKKVMTKEKNLYHAYFQDHDPDSLVRLGEIEQIQLF